MKKLCFIALSIAYTTLIANIGPQGFDPRHTDYFVETGTYLGEGILRALEAGFNQIYSLEFDAYHFHQARRKFRRNRNVHLARGDSAKDLWNIIKNIDTPITFWLDAHIYPPRPDGGKNCPLLEELEQIKKHPIKTHVILIDDLRCCDTQAFDFLTEQDIIDKILEINSQYQISYIDGIVPHDVMVAQIATH